MSSPGRSRRRREGRRRPPVLVVAESKAGALKFAASLTCPDCISERRTWVDQLGVTHVDIAHDDTCPWLARWDRA